MKFCFCAVEGSRRLPATFDFFPHASHISAAALSPDLGRIAVQCAMVCNQGLCPRRTSPGHYPLLPPSHIAHSWKFPCGEGGLLCSKDAAPCRDTGPVFIGPSASQCTHLPKCRGVCTGTLPIVCFPRNTDSATSPCPTSESSRRRRNNPPLSRDHLSASPDPSQYSSGECQHGHATPPKLRGNLARGVLPHGALDSINASTMIADSLPHLQYYI